MTLRDFQEAIERFKNVLGEYSYGWDELKPSWDGSCFIFYNNSSGNYFVLDRKTHRIEKHFTDTWTNPDHKEVIYGGD